MRRQARGLRSHGSIRRVPGHRISVRRRSRRQPPASSSVSRLPLDPRPTTPVPRAGAMRSGWRDRAPQLRRGHPAEVVGQPGHPPAAPMPGILPLVAPVTRSGRHWARPARSRIVPGGCVTPPGIDAGFAAYAPARKKGLKCGGLARIVTVPTLTSTCRPERVPEAFVPAERRHGEPDRLPVRSTRPAGEGSHARARVRVPRGEKASLPHVPKSDEKSRPRLHPARPAFARTSPGTAEHAGSRVTPPPEEVT